MSIATPSIISAQRLRDLFTYNPKTGVLTRTSTGTTQWSKVIDVGGEKRERSRVIWALYYGEWPPLNMLVDHEDHNRSNNRINNLRLATYNQNGFNMLNRNPYGKGVTFDTSRNRWRAQIRIAGRKVNLGRFLLREEAEQAYIEAAKEHHKEFLCLE